MLRIKRADIDYLSILKTTLEFEPDEAIRKKAEEIIENDFPDIAYIDYDTENYGGWVAYADGYFNYECESEEDALEWIAFTLGEEVYH